VGIVNTKQRITIQALLLLLGLMTISIFFILPGYYYEGSPQKIPQEHSFILSTESPSYEYNMYGSNSGIASLLTNDTPVSIIIRYQDQAIFNATDIQEISDFDIEFPISGSYVWQLEVVRQDADVSVDLTTYQWATVVFYIMPAQYMIFLIVGLGISFYALYLLFKSYGGITSAKKKGVKFSAIVMLLLLGTLLCYPLSKGTLAGDFTQRSTFVSHPVATYQFSLNVTHPTSSLNLSLLYPGGELLEYFRIHSLNSSEYPFELSVITDNAYNLTLEEVSNETDWSLRIPFDENSSSVVNFERIDTDLDIEFSVDIQFRIVAPREDIRIPAIFCIMGLSAIIGALFIAYRMDSL